MSVEVLKAVLWD